MNAGNGDTLKQEEEDFRRRIELEAEERKLEETLEYQRRIENEAKQKHLAEQHKKTARTNSERIAAITPSDAYLKHQEDGRDVNVQWKYSKNVSISYLSFCGKKIDGYLGHLDFVYLACILARVSCNLFFSFQRKLVNKL